MERKTTIKNIQRINKAADPSTTTSEHGGTKKRVKECDYMKKVIFLICQLAILLLSHFLVWGDTIILLGIAAIIVQCIMSLNFTGWISAFAYPITYLCAGAIDTPQDGNQYVFWYISYIAITVIVFVVELIIRNRKKARSPKA